MDRAIPGHRATGSFLFVAKGASSLAEMLPSLKNRYSSASTILAALLLLVTRVAAASHAHFVSDTEAVELAAQHQDIANSSLRWLQRPNLYFGMRARTQGDSPLFGLMWFGLHEYQGYSSALFRGLHRPESIHAWH